MNDMMPERHLILGGARSGKTNHAITLASRLAGEQRRPVVYVATAQALDAEMRDRIQRHRAERPQSWRTVEAPADLAAALRAQAEAILLVDCLTLWLSNAVLADFDAATPNAALPRWEAERTALMEWLQQFRGVALFVSNEVGSGIVPASALARRFQDEQGRLNQEIAALCDAVTLVVAGIAVPVKAR
ncbi:MAG TPA: bifunctional adenosylcobinamide kinase/adenosylcobinamide-phosphate guanylyltransferase [Steroidobacteraceae bacterium]|nr:bifunctional adenosylcobinamide kinase/adenosylcobinamide-phosphate guanylyltransferase [Steroidobacteraceae bacterium]